MKNKVAKTSSAGKPISFLREERVDVGVDVHKCSYSVTMWSEVRQGYAAHWTQPADSAALAGVPGIGARKLERYGAALLDVVRNAP